MGNITDKLEAGFQPAEKYTTELSKAALSKVESPKRARLKKSLSALPFVKFLATSNSENDSSKYAVL